MKQKLLAFLLLGVLALSSAYAQVNRTITGKVVGADDGLPLPGVTVKLKGTTLGTMTGSEGTYSIKVLAGSTTLQFSFLGYSSQDVRIGSSNNIDVRLISDATALSEVVVTGYQTFKKGEATGASAVVKGDVVQQKPIISIAQLLQGTAPGLQVTGTSGRPGANAIIKIRGTGSITAGSEPLIILDGVQIQSAAYNGINPNDIEQITVLKDAAASAIYGSRAANGVLVVTTKSGKVGKPVLQYSFQRGMSETQELKNVRLMTSQEKLQYEYELGYQNPYLDSMIANRQATGAFPAGSNIQNLSQTQRQGLYDLLSSRAAGDWRDVLLRKAMSSTHEVSLSGAADKMKYFLSLSANDNEGTEVLSDFNRKGGRLNVDYQAKDWFRIGSNIGVTNSRETQVREPFNTQNLYASTFLYNPYEPVYNANGTFNTTMQGFSSLEGSTNNPFTLDRINTFGSMFGEAKFFNHLTLRSQIGINYNTLKTESYLKPGSNLANILGYNSKTDGGNTDFYYGFTNTANWNQTIATKHSINVLLGTEVNKDKVYSYSMEARNFPTPNVNTLENGSVKQNATTSRADFALLSYFANVGYDFNKKYFLTLSGRRDGSSRFGQNNRFANFYAVGAAWDIKSEGIIKADWVNSLKLNASIGTAGNNNIGNYDALGTYALNVRYNDQPAAQPARLPNPDLTWETKEKKNIGLSFELFNSRLSGSVDYYNDVTRDLLYNINVSALTGFTSYRGNIGSMQNKGIEAGLNGVVVRNKDLNISLNVNYSNNDNKITKLYSDNVPTTYGRYKVGEPIESYFLVKWAGINPANGKNQFYNIDGTITETYSSSQAVLLKGKAPLVKFFGNFGTDITYKGLDFSARAYFSGGNYILNIMDQVAASDGENYNNNQFTTALDYWKKPGDNVRYANPLDPTQNVTYDTDKYLEKGDYISLRDVTLGYTLDSKYSNYIKANSLRVFVQGTNVLLGTKFRGTPELGESNRERSDFPGTFNLYGYPPIKAYTFGVSVKF